MPKINFRLIIISDRTLIPDADIVRVFSSCAHLDSVAFELREKDLPSDELVALAKKICNILPTSVSFIMNSSVEVAKKIGCGIHLPESVEDIRAVRKTLGEKILIGVSTHSLRSALKAEREGADYIVFGPVYETASKKKFGSPQGVEKLKEVVRAVSLPVFAIGGLTPERMRECLDAGAYGGACISYVMTSQDPAQAVQEMVDIMSE